MHTGAEADTKVNGILSPITTLLVGTFDEIAL